MNTKFMVGDQVKIVKFEDAGKLAIVVDAHQTQGYDMYPLYGDIQKKAWYSNDELELVYRPNYIK